jgi:hypothetical protein
VVMMCETCRDTRWVCEAHPDLPWNDHPTACRCGEPGMPCPDCNEPEDNERPDAILPTSHTPRHDRDKGTAQ